MTSKRLHLPKEGFVDPQKRKPGEQFIDTSNDVEGHGLPLPAPPVDFRDRGAGHGGEALPTANDEETDSH
ncbi:MAG TPA: hypothetical protein VF494_00115 [Candidatus Limnocylindrales bacterium]